MDRVLGIKNTTLDNAVLLAKPVIARLDLRSRGCVFGHEL
jgi:hypothetical protein